MKNTYKMILALMTLCVSFGVSAQENLRSAYFLDGYTYRYRFNPAFQGERGFIAMPFMGNMALGLETNYGLSNFIYPSADGKRLMTFLHPEVSDETFMKTVRNRQIANVNLDETLFALGFRTGKCYHTLDLGLKVSGGIALPGELFRAMKVGASDGNTTYDMKAFGMSADAYAQLAYGFSYKVKDWLSVGARIKVLGGLGSISTDMEKMNFKFAADEWKIEAKGAVQATGLLPEVYTMLTKDEESDEVPDLATTVKSLTSAVDFGAAVDLGISADFLRYFTVSASVTDLGFMKYTRSMRLNLPETVISYTGFDIDATLEDDEEFSMESLDFDGLLEDVKGQFKDGLGDPETVEKQLKRLACTVHLGLEARLPGYERIAVGVLGTHRFNGVYSFTEGRFSLNWALFRWLSLSGNYAISNYGTSFGGVLNLHPKGFNIFVGVDSFRPLLNVTPSYIPLNEINTNLAFGLNFSFGKYNGRYPKKVKKVKLTADQEAAL